MLRRWGANTSALFRPSRFRSFSSAPASPHQDEVLISTCKRWVHQWVIANKLCPWTAGVYVNNAILYSVDNEMHLDDSTLDEDKIHTSLKNIWEVSNQILDESSSFSTALIIFPKMTDFGDFLDFAQLVETCLEKEQLDEHIQVAHFHPDYQFQDAVDENDVENFTNRSPFPILHLIKVSDLHAALEAYPSDPADIWKKNKVTMKALGLSAAISTLADISRQPPR